MPAKRTKSGGNAKAKKPKVTTTAKKSKVEREPSAPWEEGRVATEDELFMWGCMKGKELEEEVKLRELSGPKSGTKGQMIARLATNRPMTPEERKEWVEENLNKNPFMTELFTGIMEVNEEDAASFKGRSRMQVAQNFAHIPVEVTSLAQIKALVKAKKLKGCGKSTMNILTGFFECGMDVDKYLAVYAKEKKGDMFAEAAAKAGGVNVEGESKSGGGALEPVMSKKQMKKRISLVLDVVMSEEDKHPEGLNVGSWTAVVAAHEDYVSCGKDLKAQVNLQECVAAKLKAGLDAGELYVTDEAETVFKKC